MSGQPTRETLKRTFWVAVAASLILGFVPFGDFVLYPFALIGTWAHEMGHGLAAIAVGGEFSHLELYANLGGVAYSTRPNYALADAFIAAAGLIGPAVAGGAIVVLGAHKRTATWIMDILAGLLLVSALVWIRNAFGFAAIVGLGLAAAAIAHFVRELVEVAITQFVGIRLSVEAFSSVDYMFTKEFTRGSECLSSDTQAIAEALGLTYWFWGGLIAATCLALLAFSYWFAWSDD